MRRRRMRAALLVVVAGAFAGIAYQTVRSIALRKAQDVAEMGEKLKAEVAQQMRNFKRLKVERGRTVWEIEADQAEYMQDQTQVLVQHPRVTVHMKDSERIAVIAGTQGTLHLVNGEVTRVDLNGSVTVVMDDMELTTDVATYDQQNDMIRAPGPVVLKGQTMDVHATGMEVEVKPQLVRLLADVQTVLRSRDAQS